MPDQPEAEHLSRTVDGLVPAGSLLRRALDDAIAGSDRQRSLKSLTVLASQNDPFRIDTPAGHRDGAWLAMQSEDLGLSDRTIHLRGLHYALLGRPKPDGTPYANSDRDWTWLQEKAADAARWLGYLPFDRITDARNSPPVVRVLERTTPRPYLSVGVHVDIPSAYDIEPLAVVLGFAGVQPYKLVLVGEKSSLTEVLGPVAAEYGADLYLPTGCLSDTMIHGLAQVGADDGRPMAVLYFADCDPSGWNMPIEVGRKLQAFQTLLFPDLRFEVHRVALTPDQVREYGLPSTPLKDTEKRADRWREAMDVDQTEVDALASLRPDLLRQIAVDALAPFFDATLDRRVFIAEQQWRDEAQAVVDGTLDQGRLARIRSDAAVKLAALRSEIDAINAALRVDASDFDLPTPVVPEAEVDGSNGTPLLDSKWTFEEQCQALIASKGYRR